MHFPIGLGLHQLICFDIRCADRFPVEDIHFSSEEGVYNGIVFEKLDDDMRCGGRAATSRIAWRRFSLKASRAASGGS